MINDATRLVGIWVSAVSIILIAAAITIMIKRALGDRA